MDGLDLVIFKKHKILKKLPSILGLKWEKRLQKIFNVFLRMFYCILYAVAYYTNINNTLEH